MERPSVSKMSQFQFYKEIHLHGNKDNLPSSPSRHSSSIISSNPPHYPTPHFHPHPFAISALYLPLIHTIHLPTLSNKIRFDITPGGQQVHIAFGENDHSRRHPCFKLESLEALIELRARIWSLFESGGDGKPQEADKPGEEDSGEFTLSLCLRD